MDYLHCKLCINKEQSRHLPYSLLVLRNKRQLAHLVAFEEASRKKVQKENERSIMTNKIRKNFKCKCILEIPPQNATELLSLCKVSFASHLKK